METNPRKADRFKPWILAAGAVALVLLVELIQVHDHCDRR